MQIFHVEILYEMNRYHNYVPFNLCKIIRLYEYFKEYDLMHESHDKNMILCMMF